MWSGIPKIRHLLRDHSQGIRRARLDSASGALCRLTVRWPVEFNKHPSRIVQRGDPVVSHRMQVEHNSCHRALTHPNPDLGNDRVPKSNLATRQFRADLGLLEIKVQSLRIRKMPDFVSDICRKVQYHMGFARLREKADSLKLSCGCFCGKRSYARSFRRLER